MTISAATPADIAEQQNDRPVITPVAVSVEPLDIPLKVQLALTDPDIVWEGLSSEGVQYPFPDNSLGATREQRQSLAIRRREYDDCLAIYLGDLIREGDYAEFGRLMAEQVIGHTQRSTMHK